MKYITFESPNDTLHISQIAIGSAMSMGRLSKEEFFRIYDLYMEKGGNCFDTARAYFNGMSEALLGEYFKSRGNRDRVVLCTKGGHFALDGSGRLSKSDLEQDLDESLKTLGTDRIDLYWIHKDDRVSPVEDVIDKLNEEVRKGKISVFGCSNWKIDRIAKANQYAEETGQLGFAASQIQWSLAVTEEKYFEKYTSLVMDEESYRWYDERHFPIFAFSAQAQGFFAKVAAGGLESIREDLQEAYGTPGNLRRLQAAQQYAEENGVSISAPVLAYLLNNRLPCIPVIGATSEKMLLDSLSAAELNMTAEESDALYRAGLE